MFDRDDADRFWAIVQGVGLFETTDYAQSWTPEVQKLFAGQQTPEGVLSNVQSDYERQVKRGG